MKLHCSANNVVKVGECVNRTAVDAVELISSPIPTTDFFTPSYVWERFSLEQFTLAMQIAQILIESFSSKE